MACEHLPTCVADCISTTAADLIETLVEDPPQYFDVDGNPIQDGDQILRGVVDGKTGLPVPTDGAGRQLVTYLPQVRTADDFEALYDCVLGDQTPIYCARNGTLWTLKTRRTYAQASTPGPSTTLPLQEGTVYRRLSLPVTNNDPCGRDMRCCITIDWAGWAADFPTQASGIMQYVGTFSGGIGAVAAFSGAGIVNYNTGGGRHFFDGYNVRQCFTLAAGQTVTAAAGLRFTQGTGAGDPLPVLFSDQAIYRTLITAECETLA